jgi:hypothetical protein
MTLSNKLTYELHPLTLKVKGHEYANKLVAEVRLQNTQKNLTAVLIVTTVAMIVDILRYVIT